MADIFSLNNHNLLGVTWLLQTNSMPANLPACPTTRMQPETQILHFLSHDFEKLHSVKKHGSEEQVNWKIECELSGGNMNWSFLVSRSTHSSPPASTSEENKLQYLVKFVPPFVKCMGPSWEMSSQRSAFEAKTLEFYQTVVPQFVPRLYHYDFEKSIIVMEYIQDCVTLRHFLIHEAVSLLNKNQQNLTFASDLGTFLAKTLFSTSDLVLSIEQKMKQLSLYAQNYQVCTLTDKVIFTEPYDPTCPHNNLWCQDTEDISTIVREIQGNQEIRKQVSVLRQKFRSCPQALLHGDLHTGSILLSNTHSKKTTVIDAEFSFYGPMGFDIGKLIGNFILSACCQQDRNTSLAILYQITVLWTTFSNQFTNEWMQWEQRPQQQEGKSAQQGSLLSYQNHHQDFLLGIFKDSIGYAACSMIRRVVGVAPCPDLYDGPISSNPAQKVACASRILLIARTLLLETMHSCKSIDELSAKLLIWFAH